jgi:hypothetical protein
MEWCLYGQAASTPRAGWLDNVCLYVAGLECPSIPGRQPGLDPIGGEPPSGPGPDGLPAIPEDLDFGGLFGRPDPELLQEMLLRP